MSDLASSPRRAEIAVIGAGPAGLMAAEIMSRGTGLRVTAFDAMPSPGRKLLMAGRGGLNLTHNEPINAFMTRYGAQAVRLHPLIERFSPGDLRRWCEALGQETFVGSSGRVFPKAMKASGLLRAWLRRLDAQGVELRLRHRWKGWTAKGQLLFATPAGESTIAADATVLALGGASWPRLGSDGAWVPLLADSGIAVTPLQPANCGFQVGWSEVFRQRFEGQPLKGIAMTHGSQTSRSEAMITASGLEGGAVYQLSSALRGSIMTEGRARITIDLKPDLDQDALCTLLQRSRRKQSLSNFLRKAAHLSPASIGLLHEAAYLSGNRPSDWQPQMLAAAIKAVPLTFTASAPIARAISSAGGIAWEELDANLMLAKKPGIFVAGEMLDWEAPTGGYLLQACFATGSAAGYGAIEWLTTR